MRMQAYDYSRQSVMKCSGHLVSCCPRNWLLADAHRMGAVGQHWGRHLSGTLPLRLSWLQLLENPGYFLSCIAPSREQWKGGRQFRKSFFEIMYDYLSACLSIFLFFYLRTAYAHTLIICHLIPYRPTVWLIFIFRHIYIYEQIGLALL
jgi:hypothetical protein